ncbi:nuclear transport factor 2 family protein [Nocardioides sp.]|uniref:nuclear transport factor 2 family protein n=1 Tax=Nocardioides sp. TaxID=35761 RepID=UPI002733C7CD|nr:nuclear transport factor 2 family protein [Nocardioides sp.]MDP3890680.1 nuclear transport factor 2 family protein [Nocardioides sp.]
MITSDRIIWNAPNGDHPARAASQRSYSAVSRGDLEEWLGVYAEDAVIEDPVGPSMFDPEGKGHHGHAGIRAFWDLAIASIQEFTFTIHDSHANGVTCANIGTITTRFGDGTVVDTDLVMVYTVNDEGQVASMRAYWEPERAMATARKE